jgi:hypothetical protein
MGRRKNMGKKGKNQKPTMGLEPLTSSLESWRNHR